MNKLFILFGLTLLASSCYGYSRTVRYDGQKVLSCPVSQELLDIANEEMDVWKVLADGTFHVRVNPIQMLKFKSELSECQVAVEDVELFVQEQEKMMAPKVNADWFEAYHRYQDIYNWYRELASNYSSLASFVTSIGQSSEGRAQPAIHITAGSGSGKPVIYWQCQIHAREWISGAVCQFVVNHFLSNYGRDSEVTEILDRAKIVVVPFVNPDGYEYSWTNDRLWRKSRNTNSGSTCRGTDLNRNYNTHWGQGGSSSSPCSDTYMGSAANSAPETKNTIAHFKANTPVYAAIDWHSYSQLILRPWGWTSSNSPDEAYLKRVGDTMSTLIRDVYGTRFTSQKSIDLYVTTGTASDWFYDTEATNSNKGYRAAGYTIELRDTGRYGFQLPPDQIIPSGEEIVPAIIYWALSFLDTPLDA